jgi:hypothetical protein
LEVSYVNSGSWKLPEEIIPELLECLAKEPPEQARPVVIDEATGKPKQYRRSGTGKRADAPKENFVSEQVRRLMQFVVESDDEENDAVFFEREAQLRKSNEMRAAGLLPVLKPSENSLASKSKKRGPRTKATPESQFAEEDAENDVPNTSRALADLKAKIQLDADREEMKEKEDQLPDINDSDDDEAILKAATQVLAQRGKRLRMIEVIYLTSRPTKIEI